MEVPAQGKLLLEYIFYYKELNKKEKVLFITLEDSEENIRKNNETLGVDLKDVSFLDISPTSDFFAEVESYDIFSPADVVDKTSLENAKKIINEKFGKIDILINCAGGNSPKATTSVEYLTKDNVNELDKSFFGLDIEGFRNIFDLNILGTILPTMVFTKDMIETGEGSIVNISSMNSYKPLTKIPAYSSAKAAINNLTEWLAVHFAKVNIRVNAISPGFFLTKQNKFLLTDEKTGKLTPRGNKIISGTPLERLGEPDELQGTLLYLISDMSKFVTGVIIPVDGGFNAYSGV